MQQGAGEQYPSLVFVGAVTPGGGRLVGLPVNATGNEVAPAAGYSTSPPYGIIGSVSYLREWVQFGSDWHINGGFIYGVKAELDWDHKQATVSWLWPNLSNRRIETVPYPSLPVQHLNMGFMYADGRVGTSGMPFLSSSRAGAGDPTGPQTPAGTLQRVDASPVGAVATPIFRNTTHPTDRDLRATPCIAQGPGTGELLYFVTSTGWLYAVTSTGAMPLEFPVYLGGTVGSTEPYGARPHVVIDGEGIIYIGNNSGVMRAIWAKRS